MSALELYTHVGQFPKFHCERVVPEFQAASLKRSNEVMNSLGEILVAELESQIFQV